MPTRERRLKKEARDSTIWRGHLPGRWEETCGSFISRCRRCGKHAVVDLDPAPNGIDICGQAVALGCKED